MSPRIPRRSTRCLDFTGLKWWGRRRWAESVDRTTSILISDGTIQKRSREAEIWKVSMILAYRPPQKNSTRFWTRSRGCRDRIRNLCCSRGRGIERGKCRVWMKTPINHLSRKNHKMTVTLAEKLFSAERNRVELEREWKISSILIVFSMRIRCLPKIRKASVF